MYYYQKVVHSMLAYHDCDMKTVRVDFVPHSINELINIFFIRLNDYLKINLHNRQLTVFVCDDYDRFADISISLCSRGKHRNATVSIFYQTGQIGLSGWGNHYGRL